MMGSTREHLVPQRMMSMARDLPTALIRRCVPPMPGITPSVTSGCACTADMIMQPLAHHSQQQGTALLSLLRYHAHFQVIMD